MGKNILFTPVFEEFAQNLYTVLDVWENVPKDRVMLSQQYDHLQLIKLSQEH